MADIEIKWAGPADADASSTYRVERTTDNVNWTTLAAAQAATAPYASPSTTLSASTDYGDNPVSLADASAFSTSGAAWVDGQALISWTGKSGNDLTGVSWESGAGAYTGGSEVIEAHESHSDLGVSVPNNMALYRITHTDSAGIDSAPTYLPYFVPPAPESSDHCVVVVLVGTDVGVNARSNITVQCYLSADDNFAHRTGEHLDQEQSPDKTATTNEFGLAFFQCWKTARRSAPDGSAAGYVFVVDEGAAGEKSFTASTIPDRDWILLSEVADG